MADTHTKIDMGTASSAADRKRAKPKRPLSAYNLFYRFKRAKILEAHKNGDDSKEAIDRLIAAVPGLEEYSSIALAGMTVERMNEISRNEIRSALRGDNLSPKDTRNRTHRKKSHGPALTFLEMNRIMVAAWKMIDDTTRRVFEELAEEGRRMYRKRVAEHEEKYPDDDAHTSPPKKKFKANGSTITARTPKKIQSKKIHVVDTANKNMELANDTILTPEKRARLNVLHVGKPPIVPEKKKVHWKSDPARASYCFDSIELDLESGPEPAEPPMSLSFAEIFGLEDSSSRSNTDGISTRTIVQHPPSSSTGILCELDKEFPNLPFSPVEEHDEGSPSFKRSEQLLASVDDFLELIATLDERL